MRQEGGLVWGEGVTSVSFGSLRQLCGEKIKEALNGSNVTVEVI